jgi:hypothetical protein
MSPCSLRKREPHSGLGPSHDPFPWEASGLPIAGYACMSSLDRRDFLGLLAMTALPLAGMIRRTRSPRMKARLLVTIVGDNARAAVVRGAEMGVEEAQHAARLFDGEVTLRVVPDPKLVKRDEGVHVLLDSRGLGREPGGSSTVAASIGALFMNVLDGSDDFRAACFRHVVHIAPPAPTRHASGASGDDDVVAWHPTLSRFGADTLNKRYRARTGAGMDEQVWAGWFAVKCAWEATLRSKASTAHELLSYIERETTRFDGHKGSALYFDRRHQLVQPLYIVRGGTVLSEIPPEPADHTAECTWK